MNAKQLQSEICDTMLRNFEILRDAQQDRDVMPADDVAAMLMAIAANIAQMYAERISDEE